MARTAFPHTSNSSGNRRGKGDPERRTMWGAGRPCARGPGSGAAAPPSRRPLGCVGPEPFRGRCCRSSTVTSQRAANRCPGSRPTPPGAGDTPRGPQSTLPSQASARVRTQVPVCTCTCVHTDVSVCVCVCTAWAHQGPGCGAAVEPRLAGPGCQLSCLPPGTGTRCSGWLVPTAPSLPPQSPRRTPATRRVTRRVRGRLGCTGGRGGLRRIHVFSALLSGQKVPPRRCCPGDCPLSIHIKFSSSYWVFWRKPGEPKGTRTWRPRKVRPCRPVIGR